MTEDAMVGWHHQPDGPKFEQAPGMVMDREAWHAAVHGVAESWAIKKAECQRTDAFELWCWKRLLRVP